MRINVNAFIAVVLCTALLGGLWLLNTRNVLDDGVWNPHDMYNSVGGSEYSLLNMSSERSTSSGTALSLSPSRTLSRKASSVPYHLMASSPYSPIASSPYSPIASSPISYASSDAQFHSFGGGNAVASGASVGSFRASNNTNPGAPVSLAMPSVPTYASARNVSAVQSEQATQGSSAIIAAAPAYMSSGYSYNIMRGSIAQVGANAVPATYGGSSVFGGPRYAPPTGGGYDAWLNGLGAGEGFLYVDGEGNRYYDMDLLKETFEKLESEGNLPGYLSWEDFLAQYFDQTGKHNVPLGEAWVLLLMAVAYVVLRWRRSKFAL